MSRRAALSLFASLFTLAACSSAMAPTTSDCIHPICSAFRNDGSQGGAVQVAIEEFVAVISSNGLADHPMGPYGRNPNTESAQDNEYRIPLSPGVGGEATPFGTVAVLYNGVALFNPSDARDVSGCTGNAGFLESDHIDTYGGHPQQTGVYHYHSGLFLEHATELSLSHDPSEHSPILGYAFDGYPIYGPYGHSDAMDATSAITALASCYQEKSARDCCDDDRVCGLDAELDGKILALGAFIEDYQYDASINAAGYCALNEFNMRFQVTPEYPDGTWAYVLTFHDDGAIAYPYAMGPAYYGALAE